MRDKLENIVANTPGAKAVDQFVADDAEVDVESMAMEFSFRFIELRNAAQSLDMGQVQDITLKAERGTLLVHVISEEYFAAVFLASPGYFGKGRWLLRSVATALAAELH